MGNCVSGQRSPSVSETSLLQDSGLSAQQGCPIAFTVTPGTPRAQLRVRLRDIDPAPRQRSSIDSMMDAASLLNSPFGPDKAECYAVLDGRYAPAYAGTGYLAYSMESDTGYRDWLLVQDDSQARPLTPNTLCQLMLVLQGKRRDQGIDYLKTHDRLGSAQPLPADSLPSVAWPAQFDAILGKLYEHARVVLQGDEKALMISLDGSGHALGADGVTVMDPSTGQCLAVPRTALADVIQQHLQPSGDYLIHYLPHSSQVNTGYLEDR